MILEFIPILLATLGMIFVSFYPTREKKKKQMAVIIAFIIWVTIAEITFVNLS